MKSIQLLKQISLCIGCNIYILYFVCVFVCEEDDRLNYICDCNTSLCGNSHLGAEVRQQAIQHGP